MTKKAQYENEKLAYRALLIFTTAFGLDSG